MILNSTQIQELTEIVDFFHVLFIGDNVASDILSPSDVKLLQKFGIDAALLKGSKLEDAFRFGMLASALKNKGVKNMSYEDFKGFLKNGGYVPLTTKEKYALDAVKRQTYGDIKGLGNKIVQQLSQNLVEISKKEVAVRKIIKESTLEAIEQRQTVNQLSSILGEKTKDWARDFDRISDYVMHSGYQQGIATYLLEKYGESANIYYDVYEGACEHCIRVYLTNGAGSEPKVFKLSDLFKNGSNIGRKSKDYLPSIDPLHPWCRCTMNYKTDNTVWDSKTRRWKLVRNNYGVKRKSKVIVTFN